MTTGIWQIVASACLGLAVAFYVLAMAGVRGRWKRLSCGAQAAAIAALAAALALAAIANGGWSPFDPRQIPLSLALASLGVYAALCWRLQANAAFIILDLVALGLILLDLAIPLGGSALSCAQQGNLSPLFWVLFLVGMGGMIVAGSTGLGSILRYAWARRRGVAREPHPTDSDLLLAQATSLALVFLGSGLVLSAWSAWQTIGDLTSCDPREAWIALAWLVAAIGSLARHLERHWRRWTAALALMAAAVGLLGLLGATDLRSLLGI